jgi:peptidoglycan/LPS O-acetylase OafA/YrhL
MEKLKFRFDALTSLRFFAAVYVLAFHVGNTGPVRHSMALSWRIFIDHGYLAVSFFFVLSGFLLTRTYSDRWTEGSYKQFIIARFARIYPVYVLALLIQAPFYFPTAHLPKAIAVTLMVQSWTVLPSDYPGAWNFPAWTLSVEWFFYVIFPLLLWQVTRVQRKRLAIAALLVTSLVIGGPQAAIGARLSWFSQHIPLPLIRLPEFLLGMVVATVEPSKRLKPGRWTAVAVILTVLLLSLNIHRFVTLVVVLFAATIWLLAHEDNAIRRWLELPILVLLGGASYAIYILQDPVRNWLTLWNETLHLAAMERVAYPLALIVFSVAAFVWLEKPARRWLRSTNKTRKHEVYGLGLNLAETSARPE